MVLANLATSGAAVGRHIDRRSGRIARLRSLVFPVRRLLLVIAAVLIGIPISGGAQTEVDYTYDAAGNLIGVASKPATSMPDLVVRNASLGSVTYNQNHSYTIPVTYTVENIGGGTANPNWYDLAYLSSNGVLDNNSVNLSGYHAQSAALAVGASYTVTTTFTTTATTAAGTYTLFIKADGHGATVGIGTNTDAGNVAESNEANNTLALAITLSNLPDLTVSNLSIGGITVNQNGSYNIPLTYQVNNIGEAAAQPNWWDQAYLSSNGVLDNNSQDMPGSGDYRTTALAAGGSYTVSNTATTTTTTAAGSYTLFAKADGHGSNVGVGTNTDNGNVVEANENNNTQSATVILPTKPDLTVSNLIVGTIVKNSNGSYSIPATFQVNNIGGSAAQPNWYDLVYLSSNGVFDNNSVGLTGGGNYRTIALAAGASYTVSGTSTTSTTTPAGTYTLFVKADGHGSQVGIGTNTDNGNVVESNEANNTASVTVVLP